LTLLDTRLSGLVLLEPRAFGDSRGEFFEAFRADKYEEFGISGLVQDNVSYSHAGVLRGLHLQNPHAQSKLIQALHGEVWDVAVDLRAGSPTFGQWEAHVLSGTSHRQFYIPAGFAHGFVVTQGPAILAYKCTDYYHAPGECTVRYDDPALAIEWPSVGDLIVSDKDRQGVFLEDLPAERLLPFTP